MCFLLLIPLYLYFFFFFSSRRRHTRCSRDWSSDVCSSDLDAAVFGGHGCVVPLHQLDHEAKDHPACEQPRDDGNPERCQSEKTRVARQQVARPAKPGKKRHDRGGVEPGDFGSSLESSAHAAMAAAPMVSEMKRQVPFDRQMDVDCAREKRNDAQRKTHEKK